MCDASDVVEISDDLSGIMDCAIIKAVRTQLVEVACSHGALPVSKVSGKLAECPVCGLEWCALPVSCDSVYECIAP